MMNRRDNSTLLGSIDWITILVYVLLVFMGWLNIYASVYDDTQSGILDLSQRSGMQVVWMGVCAVVAMVILLVDSRYYHIFAYPLYGFSIMLLIAVLLFGVEVNGAKSWIMIGPVGFQPTELAKVTTALAIARYMSYYGFSFNKLSDFFRVAMILGLPFLIVVLQNDMGSAIVYTSFLIVLYREGFTGYIYVAVALIVTLFIMSFLITPVSMIILILLFCVVSEGIMNGEWRAKIIYLAYVLLISLVIFFISSICLDSAISMVTALEVSILLSMALVAMYAYRYRFRNISLFIVLLFSSIIFVAAIDYLFENVVQMHQQKRILDLLGIENDLRGWGYNVNQSKIAIGSGGVWGKGFLEGTQTKYKFVPEQSTDFIFCTVGEEWGFIGTMTVLALFCILIIRLMKMGERQLDPFGRIYCYSVASILFFHIFINIGMTIGLMPVIGIPLPFFSYGGSSLVAFTILLFIAIKMDLTKRESQN